MYEIETEDVYKDMWQNKEKFDWSGFAKDSEFFDKTNEKVLGKMKDETHGNPIIEFVGLKPKMYSYLTYDRQTKIVKPSHRAKGVTKAASKNLRHEEYLDQLHIPHEDIRANRRI